MMRNVRALADTGSTRPGAKRVACQAALAWFALAVAAVANGFLREGVLTPALGGGIAGVLSIVLLVTIILAASFWLVQARWRDVPTRTLWVVGLCWALGSMAFEIGLGRALGMGWNDLFRQYDLLDGELWVFAPVAMTIGPAIMARLTRRSAAT